MIWIKLVVLLLQVAQAITRYMRDKQLLEEGGRRVIAKQLAAVAKAAEIARDVQKDVGSKTDDEIDAALRGDFRP